MFGGSWRTGFAVGVVAGVGLALLLLVWAVPEFRGPVDHPGAHNAEQGEGGGAAENKQHNEPQWRYWTRRLIAAEDTLAQWIMAFFAIFATVITAFGVFLIWQNLKLTHEAVREAANGTAAAMAGARAAQDANKVAARQFAAGFKPWLTVRISGPYVDETRYPLRMFRDEDPESRYIGIEARIEVTNAVRMPATITYCHVRVRNREGWRGSETFFMIGEGEKFIPAPPNHDQRTVTHAGMAHLGHFLLTRENREEMMMAREPIIGIIRYSDPLGIDRELGFAFEPSAVWGGGFHRWGGKEYNYDREI